METDRSMRYVPSLDEELEIHVYQSHVLIDYRSLNVHRMKQLPFNLVPPPLVVKLKQTKMVESHALLRRRVKVYCHGTVFELRLRWLPQS